MQDVPRKSSGRSKKALFVLLGFLAVVTGAVLVYLLAWPSPPLHVPTAQDHHVVLMSTQQEQITGFSAWPTHAAPYTFHREGDTFLPDGNPDFLLDPNKLEVILGTLSHIEAADSFGPLILQQDETFEDFGLGSKAFVLEAQYKQNERIKLFLGNRLYGELPLDYMMVEGSDILYAISADIRDTFDRPANHLHFVPAINFTPDLLSRLTITGESPFTLNRLERNLWMVEEPFRYPADDAQVKRLLEQIGDMRLATFVTSATPDNLEKYGFMGGETRVDFSLVASQIESFDVQGDVVSKIDVAPQTVTLRFGQAIGNTGWYCLFDDTIYQVSDLSMGFLMRADWSRFASPHPLDIPLSFVRHIHASTSTGSARFDVSLAEQVLPNNALVTDDAGDVLFELLVKRNGVEVEPSLLISPYKKLMEMRALGRLPDGYRPTGEPLMTIEMTTLHGVRDIRFYAFDGLHAAVSVDGTMLHYVDRSLVETIQF